MFKIFQVTCVRVYSGCVYVGTAWGCIIVANENNLYPITVFRPFESAVSVISPMTESDEQHMALAGQGYRSLAFRTKDMVVTPTTDSSQAILNSHIILWKHEI